MRIIAGKYRGRQLGSARDLSIRPTTDRAKQTIFDILANRIDFESIRVLDLFSGSGSLGLEALSRGAAHVTFVEKVKTSTQVLEKNIRSLGCSDATSIVLADVFWFLKNSPGTFDLVFADPPYKLESIGTIPQAIHESGVLRPGALVVMEHSKHTPIDLSESQYEITRKLFGQTVVLILRALVQASATTTKDVT